MDRYGESIERDELVTRNGDLRQMLTYAATSRCMVCGWPVAASVSEGCIQFNCCYRPGHGDPTHDGWMRRARIAQEVFSEFRMFVRACQPSPEREGRDATKAR